MNRTGPGAAALMGAAICVLCAVGAAGAERPLLHTNEAYVDEVRRSSTLAITDPMAVFAFVFDSLPDRANVYPTENYYYFTFIHGGTRYAGNIRLAASDRDEGKVYFAYYEDLAEWRDQTPVVHHLVLDGSQGVRVEKVDALVYRISYGQKSVVFALNDLSHVTVPASAVGPNEKFIGPIFDESGIRFFLVYNSRLKVFHYILDESDGVADDFVPTKRIDRILIGRRTGFAFYRDLRLDRKILIGVFAASVPVNSYFDGPFDQLPDNFIQGETLRDAILAVEPKLKGHIDRFGLSADGTSRYLIAPYLDYRTEGDLYLFHACATDSRIPAASYYACFVVDYDSHGTPHARAVWQRRNVARRK